MNVIEATKNILNGYSRMSEFTKGIRIDFTDERKEEVGLYSSGDTLVKSDVLGNQKRKHTFHLYSVNASTTDFDRLSNNNFLLELGYYLDRQKNVAITAKVDDNKILNGKITKISCSNGMKYSVDTLNKNFIYQIQINVDYKIFENWEE